MRGMCRNTCLRRTRPCPTGAPVLVETSTCEMKKLQSHGQLGFCKRGKVHLGVLERQGKRRRKQKQWCRRCRGLRPAVTGNGKNEGISSMTLLYTYKRCGVHDGEKSKIAA